MGEALGHGDGILRNNGLARGCVGRDEYTLSALQPHDRLLLEMIEFKWIRHRQARSTFCVKMGYSVIIDHYNMGDLPQGIVLGFIQLRYLCPLQVLGLI
jgi:hypothetical protein